MGCVRRRLRLELHVQFRSWSICHHSVPPTDCVAEDEAASIVEVDVFVVSLFARTAPRPSGRTLIAPGKSRPLTWNASRAD